MTCQDVANGFQMIKSAHYLASDLYKPAEGYLLAAELLQYSLGVSPLFYKLDYRVQAQ